jgi:MFS transporter, CP family, cyanate transporter
MIGQAIVRLLILSFALRPRIVAIAPSLLRIRQEFALTYAQASLLTSTPDICMGLFILFVPRISRHLDANRTIQFLSVAAGHRNGDA